MRRALVTGGSSPIGAAVSEELSDRGFHVTVHANQNIDSAIETVERIVAAGGAAETLALDLRTSDSADALEAIAMAKPFEVLVHCVGGHRDMPFAAMSREDWFEVVDLNLNSIFGALRPIILPMIRGRWGRIIAISSLSAVRGNRGQSNYAAAKGGMLALMKSLTHEYGTRGLTANVVAPGIIDTPETRELDNFAALKQFSPSGRAGTPGEVAALVGFLASDAAGYISGQLISVDGGAS